MFDLYNTLKVIFGKGKIPNSGAIKYYNPSTTGFWKFVRKVYDEFHAVTEINNVVHYGHYKHMMLYVAAYARSLQLTLYYEHYKVTGVKLNKFKPSKVKFILQNVIPESILKAILHVLTPRVFPDGSYCIPDFSFLFLDNINYDPKEVVHNTLRLCDPDLDCLRFHICYFNSLARRMKLVFRHTKCVTGTSAIIPQAIKASVRITVDAKSLTPKYSDCKPLKPVLKVKKIKVVKTSDYEVEDKPLNRSSYLIHDFERPESVMKENLFRCMQFTLPCAHYDDDFEDKDFIPDIQFLGFLEHRRNCRIHASHIYNMFSRFDTVIPFKMFTSWDSTFCRLAFDERTNYSHIILPTGSRNRRRD